MAKSLNVKGYFFYAAVQKPVTRYQKDGSTDPLDFEYKVDVLMDAADYKALTKKYKQQKKQDLPDAEAFEAKYKMAPPSDIKPNADGEYCIMSFKTNNAYVDRSTKKVVKCDKPKVAIRQENGKLKYDSKTLIGNGSKGVILYVENESKKWNTVSAKLGGLIIEELVEYSSGIDMSEFGEIEEDDDAPDDSYDGYDDIEPEDGDDDTPPFATADDDDDDY